jgi:hypothetical protein
MLAYLLALALIILAPSVLAALPECLGSNVRQWSNCTGQLVDGGRLIYSGGFVDGEKHGHGEWAIYRGPGLYERYKGEMAKGQMHGHGQYFYSSGAVYSGEFFRGIVHGRGKLEVANGDVYEGEFRNGQFSGMGRYTFALGGVVQEGIFENGILVKPLAHASRDSMLNSRRVLGEPDLNPGVFVAPIVRNRFAVIIGVEQYAQFPKALYASADARAFAGFAHKALGVPQENIRLLLDGEATRVGMIKSLRSWLAGNGSGQDSEVFIFFSGHGLPTKDGASFYFVPHDGSLELIDETAISKEDLIAMVQQIKPRSITIFVDSCYSGQSRAGTTLIPNARPISLQTRISGFPNGVSAFTAASHDQISWSSDELRHGIFSFYLMRGLEGHADGNQDGLISNQELAEFLAQRVPKAATLSHSRQQNPQFVGDSAAIVSRR